MIIRLILILTVLALVLGGVGAAFVQAQTPDPAPATTPDSGQAPIPAQAPDPAKTPEPAKESELAKKNVQNVARHDDIQSEIDAVGVKSDDCDDPGNGNDCSDNCSVGGVTCTPSVASAPSVPTAPSVASVVSAASAPSAASSSI